MSDWVERARRAVTESKPPADFEVLRGHRPGLVGVSDLRAVATVVTTKALWVFLILRGFLGGMPDTVGLIVLIVALGLALRSVGLVLAGLRRLRAWLSAPKGVLVVSPEGLLLRQDGQELTFAREDIVAITERGHWGERAVGSRWSNVYVVLRPTMGLAFAKIDPVFDESPGVLVEKLMRWSGPVEPRPFPPVTDALSSRIYDEASEGRVPEGVAVIRHGRAWLKRGPYLSVLLGSAIVWNLFVSGNLGVWVGSGRQAVLAVAALCFAAPIIWVLLVMRIIAPRKGLALVLTPRAALMRTRAGTLEVPWTTLSRVSVEGRSGWSLLEGTHRARKLVLWRKGDEPIHYDDAYLGAPAEVVQALFEHYRRSAAT